MMKTRTVTEHVQVRHELDAKEILKAIGWDPSYYPNITIHVRVPTNCHFPDNRLEVGDEIPLIIEGSTSRILDQGPSELDESTPVE